MALLKLVIIKEAKRMFYVKPALSSIKLVQSEAIASTPWEKFTQGGTIVDGAVSSHNAQTSGTLMGGNG